MRAKGNKEMPCIAEMSFPHRSLKKFHPTAEEKKKPAEKILTTERGEGLIMWRAGFILAICTIAGFYAQAIQLALQVGYSPVIKEHFPD